MIFCSPWLVTPLQPDILAQDATDSQRPERLPPSAQSTINQNASVQRVLRQLRDAREQRHGAATVQPEKYCAAVELQAVHLRLKFRG
jgi:hypothetical protein